MEIKIKWGVLGTASIAVEHVIPALLKSEYCELTAVASRNLEKAQTIAKKFNIEKYYEGYQKLLEDKEIEAVYIPLPNHLHVEWAIKALKYGKHVLVEKPIALNSKEAQKLIDESKKHPKLKIMEAFMYKFHPQWLKVRKMIKDGDIGKLKNIQTSFSFYDDNANSIVNKKEFGGGSLMDIGCYPISLSRFLFHSEPINVMGSISYHPEFKVDTLTSGILEFENGTSSFFSGTQLMEAQEVNIYGDKGRITIKLPFNPSAEKPTKICFEKEGLKKSIKFDKCDQYTLQADVFSITIIEHKSVPAGLDDALKNMIVIEKLIESDQKGERINL